MTSRPTSAFVWVWPPGASDPVVAGRLDVVGESLFFTYGRSYLDREQAMPLYLPELPLSQDSIAPLVGTAPGCIADAAPDSWGQRVILNRRFGGSSQDTADLRLLDYLLESGSDRIGAMDFQASPTEYMPRVTASVALTELAQSADLVDRNLPLTPALAEALLRGSSIGGARPKAAIEDGERRLIAKFSSGTDPYPVVQGEYVAMRLAQLSGLNVAKVELTEAMGKHVLLVERFDREPGARRRAMVSALTILGLAEHEARYASYAHLARIVRERFTHPDATLRELFSRITFNILTSNTDDHARNHASFWDGRELTLTPAYDICPQRRAGGEAQQVMAIGEDGWRYSQLGGCVERAATYHLTPDKAREIIDHQIEVIENHWAQVCQEAKLGPVEREQMWRTQFLNPYAFQGYARRGVAPARS
jgi:serine/threonine-protein kinase HipA